MKQPKYYTRKSNGKYVINKNNKGKTIFYGEFDKEEDAKKVVELLKRNGWQKDEEFIQLKRDIRIKRQGVCGKDYDLLLKFQKERNLCDSSFKGMYSTLKKYTNFHKMSFVELLELGSARNMNRFRSHMLRKYNASTLYNNGMHMEDVDSLQGRGKDSTHSAYFMEDPMKLKEKYMEYVDVLTI